MTDQLPPVFVSYVCHVLADTTRGLSGPQIVKLTAAYSVEWDVTIPHPTYPFTSAVPNKRTALYENVVAFDEALGSELDSVLIQRTQDWLGLFPDVREIYDQAVQKHANGVFMRNLLDDLRLSLELLLKPLLGNNKSLENQIPLLGVFIKHRGGSAELGNMFVKLVEYYTKYQNSYVKHDDAVIEDEVEFIFGAPRRGAT